MRNWGDHFGLSDMRTKAGARARSDVEHVALTAEIAMPLRRYAELPPWEQATARAAAVALTLDAAVVAGTAAARLHGIDVPGTGQPAVDVLHVDGKRPGGRPLKSLGIRHRYAWLPAEGVRVEHGMRVTTIGRTLRDVCAFEGLVAGVIAIDSVRRRMPEVSLGRWHEELLVGPRFKGAAVVREALALSIHNSGSAAETRARLLLRGVAGIVTIVAQAEIIDPETGRRYYVDFLINGWLVLEIDGDVKYDGVTYGPVDEIIREERRREKNLQNMGKVVVRTNDPREAPAVVAGALARYGHMGPMGRR